MVYYYYCVRKCKCRRSQLSPTQPNPTQPNPTHSNTTLSQQMVVVFRGTETEAEWTENATMTMTQLEGTDPEHGLGLLFNRKVSNYCK